MSLPSTKAQRERAIVSLLARHAYGARELTSRLGLPASKLRSVQRDLEGLILENLVERTADGRYRCPQEHSTLNPVEALAVYSAARLLYHHAAEYNEHYFHALTKLTAQLPPTARRVATRSNEVYRQRPNRQGSRTFELAAQAWLQGQVLRCAYTSLGRAEPTVLELEIYFLEIGARNHEAYAIGVNRLHASPEPRMYRLSRMRELTLLEATFEIPEEFDPERYLSTAWGVMTGAPVRVELHFTPVVGARVAETRFTPSAERKTLASGHIRVVFTVGGWQELLPWVLGWGGEVEVVEPAVLRDAVAAAHDRGSRLYAQARELDGGVDQ